MPRRDAKTDANQTRLVKIMRDMGASVVITSSTHGGFPDVVVGWGGVTVLTEIKDGNKPPSKRKLTPAQIEFHNEFKGAKTVIETPAHAIELVRRIRQVAALIHPVNWSMEANA